MGNNDISPEQWVPIENIDATYPWWTPNIEPYRIPSQVKVCPNDCPLKKNGKCIATKCILDNPSALESVKIGEKEEPR